MIPFFLKPRLVVLALLLTLVLVPIGAQDDAMSQAMNTGIIEGQVLNALQTDGSVDVIISLRDPNLAAGSSALATAVGSTQQTVLRGMQTMPGFSLNHQYSHLPAIAATVDRASLAALSNDPAVTYIQNDDIMYGTQTGTQGRPIVNSDVMETFYAATGQSVRVAVLDSGVDLGHPDVGDAVVAQVCYNRGGLGLTRCADGLAISSSAQDSHGHGTHVTGTITSNGIQAPRGHAPDAQIVAVRVLEANNAGFNTDILAGLNWIIANQASLQVDVINMSLGGGDSYSSACDGDEPTFANAVNQLTALGISVFAAAGNGADKNGISSPACLSNAISVGATYAADYAGFSFSACDDSAVVIDDVTCFSNSAPVLDLLAPGALLTSAQLGGGAVENAGTSMASPVAAGVAAQLLSWSPGLTPAQVRFIMTDTGDPVTDAANNRTTPRINAEAALAAARPLPPAVVTPAGVSGGSSATPTFNWTLGERATEAEWFLIYIAPQDNLTAPVYNQWIRRAEACGPFPNGTACAFSPVGLYETGVQYAAYIQSYGNGGLSANGAAGFAGPFTFTVNVGATATPTGLSIELNEGRPTFSWGSVADATYYRLLVENEDGTVAYDQWTIAEDIPCAGGTCSLLVPTMHLDNASYTFSVQAYGPGGISAESTPFPFQLVFDAPGAPTGLDVINVNSGAPLFIWTGIPGATWYNLRVTDAATGDTVIYDGWHSSSETNCPNTGTCSFAPPAVVLNGVAHTLTVQAFGSGGLGAEPSSGLDFTPNATAPQVPSLNAPSGPISSLQPVFAWSHTGAGWYEIYVYTDANVLHTGWYNANDLDCFAGTCELTIDDLWLSYSPMNWTVRGYSPAATSNYATPQAFSLSLD